MLLTFPFIEYFRLSPKLLPLILWTAAALHFESANSSVIKSIRQRDFLNTWLRLYARGPTIPR
ncbi:hypothetical protein XH92_26680 [Bradyrhizobium sp. CCBAU 53421]|nr:hypothetical protein XH92_26680 [Bradyrhizobium sp. CCBAU 53421]